MAWHTCPLVTLISLILGQCHITTASPQSWLGAQASDSDDSTFYPGWDLSTRSLSNGSLCNWAAVNRTGGLSAAVSLLLGQGRSDPSGWTTMSRDTAPRWHQPRPWLFWTHEGLVERHNVHPILWLLFINTQPKKKHRHRGVCFPSNLLAPFAWMGCSFPPPNLSIHIHCLPRLPAHLW